MNTPPNKPRSVQRDTGGTAEPTGSTSRPAGTPIDLDKLRSIGVMRGGRTRDRVIEGRDGEGNRTKTTVDQLGNRVTEGADDRRDVTIVAPRVVGSFKPNPPARED